MNNRNYFLLLFLLSSQVSLAQEYVEIFAIDCRTNEERALHEVEIFHNNHSYSSRYPSKSQTYDGFRIYDDYEEGIYFIEYKSIFGRIERKEFNIVKGHISKINICVDKINHKMEAYSSIIQRLKDGEKYSIQNTYLGSFDNGIESIEVRKEHGVYFAKFKDNKKKLSKREVELFRDFELELNILHTRGQYCSWSNSFLLSYKGNTIKVTDRHCDWNGWVYLLNELGWGTFKANKT